MAAAGQDGLAAGCPSSTGSKLTAALAPTLCAPAALARVPALPELRPPHVATAVQAYLLQQLAWWDGLAASITHRRAGLSGFFAAFSRPSG